jgi:hypothetical protein
VKKQATKRFRADAMPETAVDFPALAETTVCLFFQRHARPSAEEGVLYPLDEIAFEPPGRARLSDKAGVAALSALRTRRARPHDHRGDIFAALDAEVIAILGSRPRTGKISRRSGSKKNSREPTNGLGVRRAPAPRYGQVAVELRVKSLNSPVRPSKRSAPPASAHRQTRFLRKLSGVHRHSIALP